MYGGGGGRAERPAWAPQIYPEPHLRLWRHAGPRLSLTLLLSFSLSPAPPPLTGTLSLSISFSGVRMLSQIHL